MERLGEGGQGGKGGGFKRKVRCPGEGGHLSLVEII
jgi:hypothetical protein